jgi:hypothetical protein
VDRQASTIEAEAEDAAESAAEDAAPTPNRYIPQRGLVVLGTLGLAVPVLGYLWFLHTFALNVIFWDQWSDVYTVSHVSLSDLHVSLGNLWAQHGDHRIFFPNLIMIVVADLTHFNVVVEEYLSAIFLIAATGLFVLAHRRRAPTTPLLYYCPLVLLLLTVNQVQNMLWGFQMAWYLVLLALAVTLYLLDSPRLTTLVLVAALATAVVGSFSSLQGLMIWPAGLVLLLLRRRRWPVLTAWVVGAVVTTALYFRHFQFNQVTSCNDSGWDLSHPAASVKFFFFTLGSVIGAPTADRGLLTGMGLVLFALGLWVIIAYGRPAESGGSPLGVALVVYGLLFTGIVTQGRACVGVAQSRYNTNLLLVPAGCYLALLNPPLNRVRDGAGGLRGILAGISGGRWSRRVAGLLVAIAVVLELVLGTGNGLDEARAWSAQQREVGYVTQHIATLPNRVVEAAQVYPGAPMSFLRYVAHIAQERRLSVFDTPPIPYRGIFQLETSVVRPAASGTTVSGSVVLVAGTVASFGIASVRFVLTGPGGTHKPIAAESAGFGWIAAWNTKTVSNGTYTLRSVAQDSLGNRSQSRGLLVRVRNRDAVGQSGSSPG